MLSVEQSDAFTRVVKDRHTDTHSHADEGTVHALRVNNHDLSHIHTSEDMCIVSVCVREYIME